MDGMRLVEIFGADAVLRLPGAEVAHEPTRRWLAEVGLPLEAADLRLESARELRTAAEASPRTLPKAIGDMLVLGTVTDKGATVLLDGTTGAVFEGYLSLLTDGRMEPELLASDLSSLVRLAAAVQQMHRDEGEFARFAGRYGPAVVAELTGALLGLIREQDPQLLDVSTRISAHWRVIALLAPLARIAGPGDDLALDLPRGLLAEAFEKDDLCLYDDADLPDALTHEPSRRFLREHGLADANYCMFDIPAQTLPDYLDGQRDAYPDYVADYVADGEAPPDDLIRLGWVADGVDLVLEGATGRVLGWFVAEGRPRPINTDLSTVAFAQWLIRQVQLLDPVHDITDADASLVTNLTRILGSADPLAAGDHGFWPALFEDGSAAGIFH